nr:MAG TPA: hypothetical protein [Caudoviricetes sp.]
MGAPIAFFGAIINVIFFYKFLYLIIGIGEDI